MLSVGTVRLVMAVLAVGFPAAQRPSAQEKPDGPPPIRIQADRIEAQATVPVDGITGIGVTDRSVWFVSRDSGTVHRLDPESNTVAGTVVPGEWPCGGVVEAFDSLWIPLCGEFGMARVNPVTAELETTFATGIADGDQVIATGVGSIWMLTGDAGTLARIDPDTNKPVAETYLPPGSRGLVFGLGALWAAGGDSNTIARIDPHTNLVVESILVGKSARQVAVGEGAVWTLNAGDGSVSRIDPKTNKVAVTIPVGEESGKGHIAVGEGSVWISAPGAPLTRIDPASNRVVQVFTGDGGGLVAVGHGSLWLQTAAGTISRVDPRFVSALR